MKQKPHDPFARVMALTVATGRAGFVVLEGPTFAVDWGTIKLQGLSQKDATEKIIEKIAPFLPDVLILEDTDDDECRKGDHSKAIIKQIAKKVGASTVEVRFIARVHARRFFPMDDKRISKDKIARVVLKELPELGSAPRERKAWLPEQYRMAIFEAASFALAFYKAHEA